MRVSIERLGINGEGVAKGTEDKYKDKICFVPMAITDEKVDIDIVQDKKNYCLAKVNKIINASEHRITPPCCYFGKCGGCDIQHMDKSLQKTFKTNKVKETITKIAKEITTIDNVVRVNDFYYRNKMVFPIENYENKPRLGMFSANSHSIVNIHKCMLCTDIINRVYLVSKDYFENSNFHGFDFKQKRGDIKYLVVRTYKDKVLVTIVATKKVDLNDYYKCLKNNFDYIGLSLIISNSEDEILSGKYIWLDGLKSLDIVEFGIKYSIDNLGFMQVNDEIKNKLYGQVLEEIKSDDCVIDCYSGAGLMSAIISKKCKSVVGIEINQSASNSAKLLAKENNIKNIEFITGDVKVCVNNVLKKSNNCVVILDPPRSGCNKEVLESLIKNKVRKIIYISCNPSTLARDLSILKSEFQIEKVIPWDMFPQTKHVETLVCLQRQVLKN